jgi:hypothetical protein
MILGDADGSSRKDATSKNGYGGKDEEKQKGGSLSRCLTLRDA